MKNKSLLAALLCIVFVNAGYADVNLNLPANPVVMTIDYPVADSYWGVTFTVPNDGTEYSIKNGIPYDGWCADSERFINEGQYTTSLYSALELTPEQAALFESGTHVTEWKKIAYIVNKDYSSFSKFDCVGAVKVRPCEIQWAIWDFRGMPSANMRTYLRNNYCIPNACLNDIISDANANGGVFDPEPTDVVPVIAYTQTAGGTILQLILIEIPNVSVPEFASAAVGLFAALGTCAFVCVRKR
jgi:hypothetical protein